MGKRKTEDQPLPGQASYDAIETLVKGLVDVTGATPEAAQSFAQAFLPSYSEAVRAMRDAADEDALKAARWKLGNVKVDIALRGGNHGVEIDQSRLEAVYGLLDQASA